jgi:preprotein translocase subunit SecA
MPTLTPEQLARLKGAPVPQPVAAGVAAVTGGSVTSSSGAAASMELLSPSTGSPRTMRLQRGDETLGVSSAASGPAQSPDGQRLGRNDPCWCGSGKKFKRCHGS